MPDLVPLLSWLFLRGKCRHCGSPVSSRYFFVELFTGALWGAIWYVYMVQSDQVGHAVVYALGASALVAIIAIDLELYIIPDSVNAFLLLIGLAFNVYLYGIGSPAATTWGLPSSVAGALTGIAILWGIAFLGRLLFGRDAMGHGDIKMARGTGAILFPAMAVASFGIAIVLGAVLGVIQVFLFRSKGHSEIVGGEGSCGSNSGNFEGSTEQQAEDEEELPPESIGSLLKCGLGYVLCIDCIGLIFPKLYQSWFGESPYLSESAEDTFEVERTMIPFGPYLALGAIAALVFQGPIQKGWDNYWNWAMGDRSKVEQARDIRGL